MDLKLSSSCIAATVLRLILTMGMEVGTLVPALTNTGIIKSMALGQKAPKKTTESISSPPSVVYQIPTLPIDCLQPLKIYNKNATVLLTNLIRIPKQGYQSILR